MKANFTSRQLLSTALAPSLLCASLLFSATAEEAKEAAEAEPAKLEMVPFEEYSPDAFKLAEDLKETVVESSLDFARDPRLAAAYYLGLWEYSLPLEIELEFTDTDTFMEAVVTIVETGNEESEYVRRVFSLDMEMDPHPGVWIPVDISVGVEKKEG